MNFLNCSNVFPFAYGPENHDARNANSVSRNKLLMKLDMTVTPRPECAAVALIFDAEHKAPSNVVFDFNFNDRSPDRQVKLIVELKKGSNKLKYREIQAHCGQRLELRDIDPETCEIVFACFGEESAGKKSDIIVTAKF